MKKIKKILYTSMIFFIVLFGHISQFHVFAAEDYSVLQQVRDDANQAFINEAIYENNSFAAFSSAIASLGGIAYFDSVLANPLATQIEVDQLASDISMVLSGLVLSDTYEDVLLNYLLAKGISLTPYTLRSQIVYLDELDRIKDILDSPVSGEVRILALNTEIEDAFDLLLLLGDQTNLIALKDQIDAIYQNDESLYIPSTFQTFQLEYDAIETTVFNQIGFTLSDLVVYADASAEEITTAESILNEMLGGLVLKPDKTILISEYNQAVSIAVQDYTLASYTQFQLDINDIETVINDVEATSTDVNQALEDLVALYNNLVPRGNVLDLQTAYNQALIFNLSSYTPNSIVLFESVLEDTLSVIENQNVTQEMVEEAITTLSNGYSLLIPIADKTRLNNLNNESILAFYEEKEFYTISSYQKFKQKVVAYGTYLKVNEILYDVNISVEQVTLYENFIQEALDELVLRADNQILLSKYHSLEEEDFQQYTPASVEAYFSEKERLFEEIMSLDLVEESIPLINQELDDLLDYLILRADFTSLEEIYTDALEYRDEKYSISSYQTLQIAILYAEQVLADLNTTQDTVDQTVLLIQNRISSLVYRFQTQYIRAEINQMNANQFITLGDASILAYTSSDPSVLTVTETGIVKGVQFGEATLYIELDNGIIEEIQFVVKAHIEPVTFILAVVLPVFSTGLGLGVVLFKPNTFHFFKKIFKKRGINNESNG